MKPDKLTVHDLFQRERRYVVPLYQRPYVWTREEQWEPLWEDIERQAEASLKAQNFVPKRSHFLGAIVLNVARIVGNSVARSEVIDGQQRLTTLQLFLAALRDFASSAKSDHTTKLTRLTINEDAKSGSEASFKVWPTNADRDLFKQVLSAGSPAEILSVLSITSEDDAPRLAAAYLYFFDVIKQFANRDDAAGPSEAIDTRIFGLLQALRTALQVVVIELEDSDDPQVIFETLNARGQPLLPSDLIRNFIFLQAANNSNLSADDLYDKYWRPFDDQRQEPVAGENRFWHIPERQGRLLRPRIDLFMFHYLTMRREEYFNIGELFREFRDWRDEQPQEIETVLSDLKRHSAIFAALISPSGTDRLSRFARRLKTLDISTAYPLLLYLLSQNATRLPATDRDSILDDLESWLVRRFLCQLTNKNYNHFFVSLLSKVKTAADGELGAVVRTELNRSLEATASWPNDDELRLSISTKPIYVKSRIERSAMILRAVEEQLHTSKNEKITLPDKLTVEHLLPQNGRVSDYPFPETMPLFPGETPEKCRHRVIHTLGNLTLLTQELNSSISNGPILLKAKAIGAESDLRMNAWLRTRDIPEWTEQSIAKRGDELFELVRKIWNKPDAVKPTDA